MFQISKQRAIGILVVVFWGFLLALPNFMPQNVRDKIPSFLPSSPMVLGLDLQGGSHVLYEINRKELKDQMIKQLIGDIRQTLREKKIPYSGLGRVGEAVNVRISRAEDHETAVTALKTLARPVQIGLFGQGGTAAAFDVTSKDNLVTFGFTKAGLNHKISDAIGKSLGILADRINSLGTTEPIIQRQGEDRILVQVPGLQDPAALDKVVGQTAKLQFRLLCDAQPTGAKNERAPLECEALPERENPDRTMWVHTSSRYTVDGEYLTGASPSFDSRTNEPVVSFTFNQQGALRFGRLTQANTGKLFAIVLDNLVISAPRINEPILGGSGQISGNFSTEETKNMSIVLRSGALPAKLTKVEERSVGPSLGSDSVRAGIIAGVLGLIGVLIFMVVSYGLFGLFAVLALLGNLALLLGTLSFLGATLTLPGIAGIVLTMGMAVDSNVLVFERIREEVHNGRSPLNAIETGFSRAFSTVLDANLTTLIAAVVLFGLGSGPIRGFAVTLGLGIITTVFTAYFLTRLIVAFWVQRRRPKVVPL